MKIEQKVLHAPLQSTSVPESTPGSQRIICPSRFLGINFNSENSEAVQMSISQGNVYVNLDMPPYLNFYHKAIKNDDVLSVEFM